jgi:membrane carboxypeptidase/penicillin-binding protein PbpC
MQVVTKTVLAAASVCVLAVLADWIVFEWCVAGPVLNETQKVLAHADPEDRNPPPVVRRVIHARYASDFQIAAQVARQLQMHLDVSPSRGTLDREFLELLTAYVCRGLSDDELIGLYATLAYNGVDHGMNNLSHRLFGKPLHEVSEEQAATIETILKGPSYYLGHPDRLEPARDRLLMRIKAQVQSVHNP